MHNHFIAITDDVLVRITSRGQKKTVLGIKFGSRPSVWQLLGSNASRFAGGGRFCKLVHETKWKLPWMSVRCAMTIGTFNLHGREISGREETIAMNVGGRVAVLASHSFLVVNVLFHRKVVF